MWWATSDRIRCRIFCGHPIDSRNWAAGSRTNSAVLKFCMSGFTKIVTECRQNDYSTVLAHDIVGPANFARSVEYMSGMYVDIPYLGIL